MQLKGFSEYCTHKYRFEIYLNKTNFSLVFAERFKVKAINNV